MSKIIDGSERSEGLTVDEKKIKEIIAAWQNEPDEWVLKAATEDIKDYPPKVQAVIKEEAKRRREAERGREAKPHRNTSKQRKVKVYRILGGILCILGIFGSLSYTIQNIFDEAGIVTYAIIIDALFMFAFNIFLWSGLILLWLADKNENPDIKSKWSILIKVYVLIILIIIGATFALPFIIRMVQ